MGSSRKTLQAGAGAGLAALVAAGAFYLYGKDAGRNRRRVREWLMKVKDELLDAGTPPRSPAVRTRRKVKKAVKKALSRPRRRGRGAA